MYFKDYKEALAAANQSGKALKAHPNGKGWILVKKKLRSQIQRHPKVSLDYLSKKSTPPPSFSGTIPHTKPDPKNKIPEEQRRKVDDGVGGSREAWENKRKGYIGDGRTQ